MRRNAHYAGKDHQALYADIDTLAADNARLRAALHEIAATQHFGDCHPECDCLGEIAALAHAALARAETP